MSSAFHNHVNFGSTPHKSNKDNNNNGNNNDAMDAEVTRLRAMIDEIVANTTTTTKTTSSSAFLAAALGECNNKDAWKMKEKIAIAPPLQKLPN